MPLSSLRRRHPLVDEPAMLASRADDGRTLRLSSAHRSWIASYLLGAALLGGMTAALAVAPIAFAELPALLYSDGSNQPTKSNASDLLWISNAAFQGQEGPRWELLPADQKLRLEKRLEKVRAFRENAPEKAAGDCVLWSGTAGYHGPPASSLEDLIENSESIFRGTVVDTEVGLYRGIVGTLLEIRGRAFGEKPTEPIHHRVFFRHGIFRADGVSICRTTRRVEGAPERGDQVIAFWTGNEPSIGDIRQIEDRQLLWADADGRVSAPRAISLDPALTRMDALAQAIDSLFIGTEEE